MHPLLAVPTRLMGYVVLLLALGVATAALGVLVSAVDWTSALAFALPLALLHGFVALSAYYPCRQFDRRRALAFQILTLAVTAVAASVGLLLLAGLLQQALQLLLGEDYGIVFDHRLAGLLLVAGIAAYAVSLLAHALWLAVARSHRAELRATAARLQARDAELQMLRSQIDPHFLFNSLNSISALTAVDPAGARDMTLRLAQFFRQTLALAERERIALSDELALLEHYLAIEQVRFGETLQSRIEVDDAARAALLPPLSLQPLFENAIKHGLRSCEGGGCITLQAQVRAGFLFVAIGNPVGRLATRGGGNGLGLRNLQQRLATLYGDRARLHWQAGETQFRVELALPFEPAEASP